MIGQIKVLIVDDDEVDRENYKRLLNKISEQQFYVHEAMNAQEGFKAITRAIPDCILLDNNMPDMDGIDFVQQLKSQYPEVIIPIIMLTGQGNEEIAAQAVRLGIADYLIKDKVNDDTLRRSILSTLQNVALQGQLKKINQELNKVNKILELEQRELVNLYHVMSHELKTPIGSIRSFVAMLSDPTIGQVNDQQQEYIDYIQQSCKQLYIYIDTLLEMSRLDTGKLTLQRKMQPIEPIIKKCVMDLTASAHSKNLNIHYTVCDKLPEVAIDEIRVYQIITNLLSNAIKFTEQGSISVVAQNDDTDERFIRVTVKDTGVGIAADKIHKVFERLFQVEEKNNIAGGLGLGLSISKGLVDLHGGKMQLHSKLAVGSAFSFTLPIKSNTTDSMEKEDGTEKNIIG